MEKVILFGASNLAKQNLQSIKENYEILAFVDNDKKKWGSTIFEIEIFSPEILLETNFDYVIITSSYYNDIINQLYKMGIENIKKSFILLDESYDIDIYKSIYGECLGKGKLYNIGAGEFRHPAWLNIDYKNDWYSNNQVDINLDLLNNPVFPIESSTAEVFYTSHVIEHLPNVSVENMFNEVYRSLREGGIFRITCPNIDLEYRAICNNDIHFYYWREWYSKIKEIERSRINKPMNSVSINQLFLYHFAAQTSMLHENQIVSKITDEELHTLFNTIGYEATLDYCCSKCQIEIQRKYPGNHMNWWNPNKVMAFLKEAGFKNIYLSNYGQSASPVMRDISLFDSTHPKFSLYIEAIK